MRRLMLRFLQKRKFRLVTRWKAALKENIGQPLPSLPQFPYALIFRAFDEVLHLLKIDDLDVQAAPAATLLHDVADPELPTSDHFMELFLTGRDVLGDFIEGDPAFCALHGEATRDELRAALERVFRHLIDREMRDFARRTSHEVKS